MTAIEDILDEVDLLEVLAYYGGSETARGWLGDWTPYNCPFCGDTNGSASVSLARKLFLCHQCGAPRDGKAGDVVNIVMDQEGLDTKEAIAWINQTFLT